MYIVVDLGGTNTRIASSMDRKTILKKERFITPQLFEDGISKIIKSTKLLVGNNKLKSVAVGVPGTIDQAQGKTILVPNIISWNDKKICKIFENSLHASTKLANDAELAALGEAVFGAGKNKKIVAYLTISTGVGGSLIVDKHLVPSAYNKEPGHMTINYKGLVSPRSGRVGAFEMHASGTAFQEKYKVKAEECNDPEIWKKHAQIVGEGIINVILLWSPDIIVIGGGLSQKGGLLFKPLIKFVEKNLKLFPAPKIVPAKLGDDAGLYGGLALLKSSEGE